MQLPNAIGAYRRPSSSVSGAPSIVIPPVGGSTVVVVDSLVTRSGNIYTFTARRSGDTSSAETRAVNLAASSNYQPAANVNDFGGSFPSATASFAAGSATATFQVTSPVAIPE